MFRSLRKLFQAAPRTEVRLSCRPRLEGLEERLQMSTFAVVNTNDSGAGSLRAAITLADLTPGPDTITFNIGGGGARTITPLSPLPKITEPVSIDASTQPGFAGKPLVQLTGSSAGAGADGLRFDFGNVFTTLPSLVRGLVINRFGGNGISVFGRNDRVTISGDYIGTDPTGSLARPNGNNGVLLGGPNNLVGGFTAQDRNVISGNPQGVKDQSMTNRIFGNFIGTDATGSAALPNGTGVVLEGAVGCLLESNVISGNSADGVDINGSDALDSFSTFRSHNNQFWANKIGTDASGTRSLGNLNGIFISGRRNNDVGDTSASDSNLIAGNRGNGVVLSGPATLHNSVYNNTIKNNQGNGVLVTNLASFNLVSMDVIASNGRAGVAEDSGFGTRILMNAIFANGGLGIDLGRSVTAPAAPTLTGVSFIGNGTFRVSLKLHGTASSTFSLDLFGSPSAGAQGVTFLASQAVKTNVFGDASVTIDVRADLTGQFLTATVTDSQSGTSMFSNSLKV